MNMRKLMAVLTACMASFACALALAGCAGTAESADAATQNRAYMSQANTAMMQLNEDLAPFGEAVAAGDIVTMEQSATAAYRDIDAFKEISAPDAMGDIHAEYSAGCDDLRAALQAYIQLYRDAPSLEGDAFNARVADIQKQYDSGIEHLQKGDQLVTELTGASPSESGSAESSGGSSSEGSSESSSESEGDGE